MKKLLIEIISTFFYVGYLPASGTMATLVSLPLLLKIDELKPLYQIFFVLSLISVSVILTGYAEQFFSYKDDKKIVIDEVVGFIVAMISIPKNLIYIFLGFVIFRFFDITKFVGINKLQKLPCGWGIVIDDIVAGILSNFVLRVILIFYKI
ncbi:MAG: phosphatidylglycerophosphatase A [Endomicrobia bacterium]|nr:phosphatidylglycerophosphatase A [Endomicrobiia bacterium]